MPIALTADNYYSPEANRDYMSESQFKDLIGTTGHSTCEAAAVYGIEHGNDKPKTTSMLVGSYVDAYFEGTLDKFKEENPDIFKKTGDKGLKADYLKAETIIRRIERDKLFSRMMSGEKQVIMTAKLFGVDWKIKMDSYFPGEQIVDLKIMKDMKSIWSDVLHTHLDFIRWWGYDIQGAVYQKVVEIVTGKKLPFYVACATKEDVPAIQVYHIPQEYLDEALAFVENNINHAISLKTNKAVTPHRCEKCNYCKDTAVLNRIIELSEIIPDKNTAYADDSSTPYSLFEDAE